MLLDYETLKDKILGCWNGKNAGGVLGAPFETKRQVNEVTFYTQDIDGNPPPNDDLDLQLVWLNGIEKYGRAINASLLGEYWLSFITPNWAEYGMSKSNMSGGLQPPISGYVNNFYRDSCGCFIRSELWACTMPGHPDMAVRYAFEDAIVDHADEGLYAEIFCAAVQSAAFVESDLYRLVDIGLSYIPEDCDVAKAVRLAQSCYQNGKTWQEARKAILTEIPGTFGIMTKRPSELKDGLPAGRAGYDAPSNIGLMMIGWLYGEGDFGKSICIAVNCGEDTDCTAATLGAILGIIKGNSALPDKWMKPLNDVINTWCINECCYLDIPKTVTELTDRTLRMIPVFLERKYCDILYEGIGFIVQTADNLFCDNEDIYIEKCHLSQPMKMEELLKTSPFMVRHEFSTFNILIDYMGEPFVRLGEKKKIRVELTRNELIDHQQFFNIKLYTPDGVLIPQGKYMSAAMNDGYKEKVEFFFDVIPEQITDNKIEILVDVSVAGRHTNGIVKIALFAVI